jgi:hypothetical protein
MKFTKSIFAAIGMSVVMSVMAACGGAPSDVPMIADMKQVNINMQAGTELGELANNTLLNSAFETAGTFNWNKTDWESPKSLEETIAFYSQESLAAAGWNAPGMPECGDNGSGGVACLVSKPGDGGKSTVLLANVLTQEGKVYVVLVRIEGMTPKAQ